MNSHYTNTPRLVLGFHGCEKAVAEKVLLLKDHLRPSINDYDWLGNGIYFWENDPLRAYEFAVKNKMKEPAVIGAVIDLGNCLSLLERHTVKLLQIAYAGLKSSTEASEKLMPQNTHEAHGHKLVRKLDCAVFEYLHQIIRKVKVPEYDTVIGAFMEGGFAYDGTEISEQSHIQICVRNKECIKGYFLPLGNFEEEKKQYLEEIST